MSEENLPSGPDIDAAAAEDQAKENTNGGPKLPICPYCLHDPFNLMEVPLNNQSGVTLMTFSCADCRKLIGIVILKLPMPNVQTPPRSPLIIPGRPM